VAQHEAAHAVVAHAQGLQIAEVDIQPVGGHSKNALGTAAENARVSVAGLMIDWLSMRPNLDGFERHVFVDFIPEPGDDAARFRFWVYAEAGDDADRARALAHKWLAEAAEILHARAEAGLSLVSALRERGRLNEADVLAILGPYPEVRPETLAEREATRVRHGAAE
jgi:hypothetical protein